MTTAPSETPRRQRILLSAFACSPLWGSEPGVGWRWACELAARHEVTVLTHAYFRDQVEDALARQPVPGLRFEYFRVPGVGGHPHRQLNSRLYYWLWQFTVRRHVRRWLREHPQDLIHHLTWGSYRLPSFLVGLGVPTVIGPVGGGEGAPERWYRSWPPKERLFYRVRALSIAVSRWDPFVMWSMSRAACVLAKTPQTRDALPSFARHKAVETSEIGVAAVAQPRGAPPARTLQLLYAGRLLGGKGVPYLVQAMRLLRERGVDCQLSLAGDGRLQPWVEAQVARHRLHEYVRLLGKVPRERMDALYDASDLLCFPSWHDSSGNVVTESLARGLPVLCLDVGGPSVAVDERCALVVRTQHLDEDGLSHEIAAHIERLAADPSVLARLSAGAIERAREMSWQRQVSRTYDLIEQRLGWRLGAGTG